MYVSGVRIYNLLIGFYYGMPRVSALIWLDQSYRVTTYNRYIAYSQTFDVMLCATCLISLIITRYIVVAIWKHRLLPRSLNGVYQTFKSTAHGSASLCSLKRLYQLYEKDGIPIGSILKSSSYDNPQDVIQNIQKKKTKDILRLKVDHSVVIAPSGAGKGIGIVIPTLLDYEGSVLVTDIKGENYAVTAEARRKKGRKVYALDPFRITDRRSLGFFNVLDFLDPTQESVVDDSATLAHLLCPVSSYESGVSQYFASQAAAVLQCLILYVVYSKDIKQEDKHLGTVYDLLCQDSGLLKNLFCTMGENKQACYGAPARLANRILGTESRELSGTLNSACLELRFLESSEVRHSVSRSNFSLEELVTGKSDLYLCIPSEKLEVQSRLLRLMVGSVFMMVQKARGKVSERKFLMLLDEMPALGYMSQIENALTYGRGYGVSLMVISQTLERLKSVYPQSWQTFLSCPLSLFFGTSDYETSELVSESLGKATVQTRSENKGYSHSKQEQEKFGATASHSTSNQTGSSFSETGRALLTPDEVRRLDPHVLIAFLRGENPILLQRLNYLTHPHYKNKFQTNPLHKKFGFAYRILICIPFWKLALLT